MCVKTFGLLFLETFYDFCPFLFGLAHILYIQYMCKYVYMYVNECLQRIKAHIVQEVPKRSDTKRVTEGG